MEGTTAYQVYYYETKEGEKDSRFSWIILDSIDNLTDFFDSQQRNGYQMNVYDIQRVEYETIE